jgi:hypothetical protein
MRRSPSQFFGVISPVLRPGRADRHSDDDDSCVAAVVGRTNAVLRPVAVLEQRAQNLR